MRYLDLVLNGTFPALNGYKTILAGGLAAIGCATLHIASVANPQTAEILMQISHYADIGAGYLGVLGVCGKIVK